jgi:hypothetical protein
MIARWVRPLFVLAALYDIVLGLVFFFAFGPIYAHFVIPLPNHNAYVELPAALTAIFGLGFALVARDPQRNRDIIRLGILMKLAFSLIVLSYAIRGAIPGMWVPLAWIDLGFAIAFIAADRAVRGAIGVTQSGS